MRIVIESKDSTLPNLNKNPEPTEPGDSSGSQSPVPPQFGSPFDYDATADASLTESSTPTEKTPSTETTGTGPGWDTYSGVGNGPGWGSHPIYPPPAGTEPTTAFPSAEPSGQQPTAPYTSPESYSAQNYPLPGTGASDGPVYGAPADPSANPYGPPPQGGAEYGQAPGYGPVQGYPPPGMQGYGFVDPSAPYGRDPMTGVPFSDKSKTTAGVLGILLGGFGAGRFYLNQPGMAVAQIAVTWLTCGIGGIWPLIDGIMMLTGNVRDQYNRPLRS